MKYIVIYESGLCLQDPDLFVYEAKNPEKMLVKVFLDKLHGDVEPKETLKLRKKIQEAFDNGEWEHFYEEGAFEDRTGCSVEYQLNSNQARLHFEDQYNSSYYFKIEENIYFPSEEYKEGYFDFVSSTFKATNIVWVIDPEDKDEEFKLPDEANIPENIDADDADKVANYLCDKFGFCVISYTLEKRGCGGNE